MAEPIKILEGERLSSVVFIHDYVQLGFDGTGLTINASLTVVTGGKSYKKGEPCYRDALCERIGQTVRRAFTVTGKQIVIQFENDSEIIISLRPEDQVSPEAAVLYSDSQPICVWN